jgi:hypothetical protein
MGRVIWASPGLLPWDPTITLGIYRHLLEEERRGYVLDLEELLKGPVNRPQA